MGDQAWQQIAEAHMATVSAAEVALAEMAQRIKAIEAALREIAEYVPPDGFWCAEGENGQLSVCDWSRQRAAAALRA